MSKESVQQFYQEEVLQNEALQQQFRALNDRDSIASLIVEVGREKGYSFTLEEVQETIDETNASTLNQELSDEQLEAVAGGGDNNIICPW